MITIPFLSQMPDAEWAEWVANMQPDLPQCSFKRFDALTLSERNDAKVALIANPDPEHVAALPNLVWVQSLWAGVERVLDVTPRNVQIVRMEDPGLAATMAEAVLAWVLYLFRDMPSYRNAQNRAQWEPKPLKRAKDCRIGILGLGKLGAVSAARLHANGFSVSGWSRSSKNIENITCYSGEDGLGELLTHTDIVVVLLPMTTDTIGLLDTQKLALLPTGASIINFARGPIIDDVALVHALDTGHINHAVLDVFEIEPLPASNSYWGHSRVTVLPHISAPTDPQTAGKFAASNIARYLTAGVIPTAVNRDQGY